MTWDESAERPEDPPGVVFLVPWELDKTGEALKAVTDVVERLRRLAGPPGWRGLSPAELSAPGGDKTLRAVVETTRSQTLREVVAMLTEALTNAFDLWGQYREQVPPEVAAVATTVSGPHQHRVTRVTESCPLECLDLPARVVNALRTHLILAGEPVTVGSVLRLWARQDWKYVRNLGPKGIRLLEVGLTRAGLLSEGRPRTPVAPSDELAPPGERVDGSADLGPVVAFRHALRDFHVACGSPGYRTVVQVAKRLKTLYPELQERDLPSLSVAGISAVLSGRRTGLPSARWVLVFVLACQRCAYEYGVVDTDPGVETGRMWLERLRQHAVRMRQRKTEGTQE